MTLPFFCHFDGGEIFMKARKVSNYRQTWPPSSGKDSKRKRISTTKDCHASLAVTVQYNDINFKDTVDSNQIFS